MFNNYLSLCYYYHYLSAIMHIIKKSNIAMKLNSRFSESKILDNKLAIHKLIILYISTKYGKYKICLSVKILYNKKAIHKLIILYISTKYGKNGT